MKKVQLDNASLESREILETIKASLPYFDHPNVLRHKQIIWGTDSAWFVMDKHKQSLETLLSRHRSENTLPSVNTILKIAYQIASAMAYLHMTHRKDFDGNPLPPFPIRTLKPTNILFNATDAENTLLFITDYGLPIELTSNPHGSVYTAPEVFSLGSYCLESDVWSFGCIVLEMTIGYLPVLEKGW